MRKALAGSLVLLAALGALWQFKLKPQVLAEQTRYQYMQRLAEGVLRFNTKYDRLPRSLEEMVAAGTLPKAGSMYFSPMAHGSVIPRTLSFKQCEYQMTFGPKGVTVAVPREVYGRKEYAFAPEGWWTMTVTPEMRLYEGNPGPGGLRR